MASTNVFAIGDVTAGPALAHRASEQGRVAAEAMCGLPSAFDQLVPMVAFCDPRLASVGLSERDAAASGRRVVSGRGSFAVNGRALTLGEATGLVKLVVDADDGVVVGAGIAGPDASELIAELTLAIECAVRLDDVLGTIHAHPTLAEAIVDAARSADRRLQRVRIALTDKRSFVNSAIYSDGTSVSRGGIT